MDTEKVNFFISSTMELVNSLSLPILIAATASGILVAVFQTATQIQEQILGFTVKLITIMLIITLTSSSISNSISDFVDTVFIEITNL